MSFDQSHVCIVDDEEFCREVAAMALEGQEFRLSQCDSGEACLALFEANADAPSLVLLDIEMQGLDGYETCRRIREMGHSDVQIIFVSSHDDLDCRLACFDAGGNDFIAKPFEAEELQRKATLAVRLRQNFLRMAKEKADAEEMSTLAIESMDEMTSVQKFLRGILGCRTLEALAKLVIGSLAPYGCETSVQLRGATETVTLAPYGEASPLEVSIFEQTKNLERIFQFRSRMVINYERISILFINMPPATDALAGRIRDYGAIVAEAADAAVEGISLRLEIVARANEMQQLARESRDSIERLRELTRNQQQQVRMELEQMVERVEGMYYRLGLTPNQEELISETVRETTNVVLELSDLGAEFDVHFGRILDGLEKASTITIEAKAEEVASTEVWL